MLRKAAYLLLGLLALLPVACGQAQGDGSSQAKFPFELTPDEIVQARHLAETDLGTEAAPQGSRTVFIKIDLLPPVPGEAEQRLVMVHHYRYHTDETIFTMIDLRDQEVLKREIQAHYPTALAPVEVERALTLARTDGRLQGLLASAATKLEARPLQFGNPEAPLFGRRVVNVLIWQNGGYLSGPRVLVDLTTETVHLETK